MRKRIFNKSSKDTTEDTDDYDLYMEQLGNEYNSLTIEQFYY